MAWIARGNVQLRRRVDTKNPSLDPTSSPHHTSSHHPPHAPSSAPYALCSSTPVFGARVFLYETPLDWPRIELRWNRPGLSASSAAPRDNWNVLNASRLLVKWWHWKRNHGWFRYDKSRSAGLARYERSFFPCLERKLAFVRRSIDKRWLRRTTTSPPCARYIRRSFP